MTAILIAYIKEHQVLKQMVSFLAYDIKNTLIAQEYDEQYPQGKYKNLNNKNIALQILYDSYYATAYKQVNIFIANLPTHLHLNSYDFHERLEQLSKNIHTLSLNYTESELSKFSSLSKAEIVNLLHNFQHLFKDSYEKEQKRLMQLIRENHQASDNILNNSLMHIRYMDILWLKLSEMTSSSLVQRFASFNSYTDTMSFHDVKKATYNQRQALSNITKIKEYLKAGQLTDVVQAIQRLQDEDYDKLFSDEAQAEIAMVLSSYHEVKEQYKNLKIEFNAYHSQIVRITEALHGIFVRIDNVEQQL